MRRGVLFATFVAMLATGCSPHHVDGPGTATPVRVRVVSQNILHGSACAPATDRCELPARVALFVRQLDAASCPEIVTLQEASTVVVVDALRPRLAKVCDGRYRIVFDGDPGNDRELFATTLPVVGSQRRRLAGPLRTAYWLRVGGDGGIVDVFATHLASSSDDRPCDRGTCPPPCHPSDMLNTCEARELVAWAHAVADPSAPVIIAGDLNATPEDPTIAAIRAAGFRDTDLAAGNAECNPETGAQCTSGRVDDTMTDLRNPRSREYERLDYVWLGGNRNCAIVAPTGLFNAEPARADPAGLAFPSDHTAVTATLECATTVTEQEAGASATMPAVATTTTAAGSDLDAATMQAVRTAFATLFDGTVTDLDTKIGALEDAAALRPFAVQMFTRTKAIASRIHVRIDTMQAVSPTRIAVVYSLLLDGVVVLDQLPGNAVKQNGRWLVSRKTFCDVSTQGASTIPAPCRG